MLISEQKGLLFTGGASQARGILFLPGCQKFSCPEVRYKQLEESWV